MHPRQPRVRLHEESRRSEWQIAPSDTCNIIEFIFLMLGTGYMISYNVLTTPIDFYDAIYSNYKPSIMYYIVPIHRSFLLFSLLLMIVPCSSYNRVLWHFLISIPFLIIFICLSIYPYLPQYIDNINESMYFIILLIICSFCGFFSGIIQCAVTSFCNYLPSQYMKASISGQAFAGIIVCFIKIITKLINDTNYTLNGKIYFLIGASMNALCAILFIGTKNTKLIKYYLKKNNQNKLNQDYLSRYDSVTFHSKSTENLIKKKRKRKRKEKQRKIKIKPDQRTGLLSNGSEDQQNNDRKNTNYCSVFNEISTLNTSVFIVMMVTFLYFPGLELSIKSQYKIFKNDDDWFGIILITEYNIFDYIGRQFLSKYKLFINPQNIITISIIRGLIIYPLFFILYKQYIISDILLHIINIIGAASNGYLFCLIFIFLNDISNNDRKNDSTFNHISATIMTLSLNLGILVGSILAILIQKCVF